MNINNLIKIIFLIILSTEIGQSLIPVERYAQSSVLVDKRIYFFGGESYHSPKNSSTLDQILYLDVSKPFNTVNPPFEEIINVPIPFGSSFATAFLSPQKNVIYLFGGTMVDTNTKNPSQEFYKQVLHSYNLETREWTIPTTNDEVARKERINGVINKETGKFYVFSGLERTPDQILFYTSIMIVFDTISLTWSTGSTINAPSPRLSYTATLLSNGIIVFIGGIETNDVDINQLALYDTKVNKWSLMTARGVTLENRNSHSAVLSTITNYSETQLLPFFYILDIRNFTWVTQFEPEELPTNSTNSPDLPVEKSDNGKQIGIILGTVGLSVGVGTVVGLLGYKYYKKQKYKRAIPTSGSPIN
ncbi:hypothetical protein RirG_119420 [Rhizophagus irregularis DAOM 197198w]|uniref:Galactose oxidase n=1 Tax=Rhizophagus irregularis (strain DAOM 197198w) TaxID=1432141 RepID=A0A015JBI8_RHIIW|nr:hypothetical protein RirG_119420 [Rhizophagus irregularis DAOM 197198w]